MMSRMEDFSPVRIKLEKLGPLPNDAWCDFASNLKQRELAKGALFARAGVDATEIGFIVSGIVRMYYVRSDGREFNKSFHASGDFFGVFPGADAGDVNQLYIGAIRSSVLFTISWESLTTLYQRHPPLASIGHRFAELVAGKKIKREASFLLNTAAERYQGFRAEYGAIENRIPDYHIASYIGITPVALSRLKNASKNEQLLRTS